jgi:hypothetical protein
MGTHGCVVGVYENEETAQAALKELQKAGFSVKQVSVVGKLNETEEKSGLAGAEKGLPVEQQGSQSQASQAKAPGLCGSSILMAGLNSVGILKENAQHYEEAVSAGKFLIVAEGPSPDVVKAKQVLHAIPHEEVVHHTSRAEASSASN